MGGCIYQQQGPPQSEYVQQPPPPQYQYATPQPPPPQPEVVEAYQPPPPEVYNQYQSDLSPYGQWVSDPQYGQCWQPYGRPPGWQPYTVGYWEDTDYGWTWVSVDDEAQWGDVTYHYGRWYESPSSGWIWIPGTTWAPAWVAWREGGGYCGWAPLPPEAGFGSEYSAANTDQYVPANRYVYVNESQITNQNVNQNIVRNNTTIINNTTNITNITNVNNHVVNQGVPEANIEHATGKPVQKVQLASASTPQEAQSLAAAGKPAIYSPPVVRQAEKKRVAKKSPGEHQHPERIARKAKGTAESERGKTNPAERCPEQCPQQSTSAG
ncbi:MAG: DUF6600 domain-containing protein [Tepidisphaeraceae bacterium]